MVICMTHDCNNQAVPGENYCLSCLSRQNGHGSDGAAMVIPAISTITPHTVQIESDVEAMQAIAELQDKLRRCKAELDRQRKRYMDQKGDLLRAQYANEQLDETIRQMAQTIRAQGEIIRRQQAKLDGRMAAIQALKKQQSFVIQMAEHEQHYAEYLSQQLEQLRLNLMQVPFADSSSTGEWAQSDPDDVTPLEDGFHVAYAKLDPETFEVNRLFWFRAE